MLKGCLYVWDTHTLFAGGPGLTNQPHGHYAASIILGPDAELTLHPANQPLVHGRAFILAPNLVHQLDAARTRLLVLHLDPHSPQFRAVAPLLLDAQHVSPPLPKLDHLDQFIDGSVSDQTADALFQRIIHHLSGVSPQPHPLDERIPTVLAAIRARLPETVTVADLAAQVDLSPDRLMHLFKDQLGLTIRRYVLWARLRQALNGTKSGANLTHAAHEAGFSDSAHLSRTFREMFGAPPSTFLGDSRFIQVRFCDP